MQKLSAISLFFLGSAGVALLYFVIRLILTPMDTLILLNSLFAGAVCIVFVFYTPIIWPALSGLAPMNSAWRMTIGLAILWAAVVAGVLASIVYRAIEGAVPVAELSLVMRYLAVVAACVQLTAPGGIALSAGWLTRYAVAALLVSVLAMGAQLWV